jgi:hypothetical protein
MEKIPQTNQPKERTSLFSSIFPREYDFEGMLARQADMTVAGVQVLVSWLKACPLCNPRDLEQIENEVDQMRHDMENKLIKSFSTPFDRQDIYSISRQMDYILNVSKETAKEMYAFNVTPDKPIIDMAETLLDGTRCIATGIKSIGVDKNAVEIEIRHAREAYNTFEEIYIAGMAELLKTNDAMHAIRVQEIYHHMRYAGRAMRETLDILHNAVIDLA